MKPEAVAPQFVHRRDLVAIGAWFEVPEDAPVRQRDFVGGIHVVRGDLQPFLVTVPVVDDPWAALAVLLYRRLRSFVADHQVVRGFGHHSLEFLPSAVISEQEAVAYYAGRCCKPMIVPGVYEVENRGCLRVPVQVPV